MRILGCLSCLWPPADDIVFFALTTSKPEKFGSVYLDSDILRVPKGRYAFFSADETILNFREIYKQPLATILGVPNFSIEGDLTSDDMMDVDNILRHSEIIEQDALSSILR